MSAESKELVPLETLKAVDVFVPEDGVQKIMQLVNDKVVVGAVDMTIEADRDKVRSLAFQIAKTKTGLDSLGKEFVAGEKKKIAVIDGRRGALWDALEQLQHKVRKPLTDYENAEKERLRGHQDAIEKMRNLMVFMIDASSRDIEERLKELQQVSARDFQEFAAQAATVRDAVQERLGEKLAAAIKAEQDAADLERLRAQEAERKKQQEIDNLAAEKAKKMIQEGALVSPPPAPAPAPAAASTQPTTRGAVGRADPDLEHKRKINRQIVEWFKNELAAYVVEGQKKDFEDLAQSIVRAMAKGEIKNVKIEY